MAQTKLTPEQNQEWECYEPRQDIRESGHSEFDICGLCRRDIEHTVAEHQAAVNEGLKREAKREDSLYKAARFADENNCDMPDIE